MQNFLQKRKFLLAGVAGALVVLSLVIGAIFVGPMIASAATSNQTPTAKTQNTKQNYCIQFDQDLAKRLGVSVDTLRQDRKGAADDVIDQMVKDGKLKQAAADKLKARIAAHPLKGNCGFMPHRPAQPLAIFKKYGNDVLTELAQGLHLSNADALKSQLKAGKSLNDIATAQHISSSDLHTLVNNTINDTLKKAVSDKTITQQRADQISKFIQNHPKFIDNLLNKHFGQGKDAANME